MEIRDSNYGAPYYSIYEDPYTTCNSIHGALQFAVKEPQTICGDPSST